MPVLQTCRRIRAGGIRGSCLPEKGCDFDAGDFVTVQFRPFEADAGTSGLRDYLAWMKKTNAPLTELAMEGAATRCQPKLAHIGKLTLCLTWSQEAPMLGP